jgi:hypothetical protein
VVGQVEVILAVAVAVADYFQEHYQIFSVIHHM